jgi:DNA-binding YbaB/EbfC family protein
MFQKLKQFKDIRDKAKSLQAELEKESVEGSSSRGKVKVTMDGTQKILKVDIDESALSDRSKLEEHVKEAFNDAHKRIQAKVVEKMKAAGDLGLPGMG